MTSEIPVQRSNQLSYQANWKLVNRELSAELCTYFKNIQPLFTVLTFDGLQNL